MIFLQNSALVMLHPESCIQFWTTQCKKVLEQDLGKSKEEPKKMIKKPVYLPYEERLKELDCLAARRESSEGSYQHMQIPNGRKEKKES